MKPPSQTSRPPQWLVIPLLMLTVAVAIGTLIWMDREPRLPNAFRYEMPDGTIPPELRRWREVASIPYIDLGVDRNPNTDDAPNVLGKPVGIAVQNRAIALICDNATMTVFVLASPSPSTLPSPSETPTSREENEAYTVETKRRFTLSAIPTCITSFPTTSFPPSSESFESQLATEMAPNAVSRTESRDSVESDSDAVSVSPSTDEPFCGEWLIGLGNRVVRCGESGEVPFAELDATSMATGLVVEDADADGHPDEVLVADWRGRCVWRFDGDGNLLNKIGKIDKDNGTQTTAMAPVDLPEFQGFAIPSPYFDVAVTPDGLVRVTNPGYHRVEGFTADGYREASFGVVGERLDQFCGCCNPIHLATLPDGRLVTVEKGLQRIKIYAANGKLEEVVAGPNDFAGGVSLLEDETFLQRRAAANTPTTTKMATETRSATASMNTESSSNTETSPPDIAVSADGTIWVLDTTRMKIRLFQHNRI